jgi:hypothetical protein
VEGFVSGKTWSEGGGIPDGYVWFVVMKGARGLVFGSGDERDAESGLAVELAAKTAGGMAWMSVSK